MANLATFTTIKSRVEKYKKDYQLEDESTAFEWLLLESLFNLNSEELTDVITDGSNDEGIDAIYINDKDVHIFSFKYASTFEKSKSNFPKNDMDQIVVTMRRIMQQNIEEKDVNGILWDKINEIWSLFEDGGEIFFKFHICTNREQPIKSAMNTFEKELKEYGNVDFIYYNQNIIIEKILEKKYTKRNGKIHFVDNQYFERSDGILKGIVATVTAIELIEMIKDENNPIKIHEDVFNENVRVYLKLTNKINSSIYATALSNSNYEFWYLNNGINIVCDKCIYQPNKRAPVAELINYQIVNGGQTTHALFEAYLKDKEKIKDVLVLLRIYETNENEKISERISETTNSQTPISTRDLRSNNSIQLKLEEQFRDLGFFYERKKNQYQKEDINRRLDCELLGQIYLAYYLDMPSEAKNKKSIIFGDKYDRIFDENEIHAEKMLLPYNIYLPLDSMKKIIQKRKRNKENINEKESFISRAVFHLLNSVKIIAINENLDLKKPKNIDLAIERAIGYVHEVVNTVSKERGDIYTHDKFFKEASTCKIIQDKISENYKK